MFSKPEDAFISLKEKKNTDMPTPADYKEKDYYPGLCLYNAPQLPIGDSDVNSDIEATVKLGVTKVATKTENGKISYTYEFDVKAIMIL